MRADAFDAALVQDDDPVGVHDRADPLSDDEYGRLAGVGAQCRAQPRIGARVERREAVVEEVDRRSLHKGARDRKALALAAGNVRPALVDGRVQPAGHLLDEVLRLGHLEGVPELLLGRILLAESKVARHCAAEQVRPLRNQPDPAPQVLERPLAYVDAVDEEAPLPDVEEARDQVQQGGLARAGAADDGGGLAGPDPEFDVLEYRLLAARVTKGHPAELNLPC